MNTEYWQRVLPPWPTVPPRLWLTAAVTGLTVFSLIFRQEIWPAHPQAEPWSWAILLVLVQAAGFQAIGALRDWTNAYDGPNWMRLLVRGVAVVIIIGIAILLLMLLLIICWLGW